MTEKTREEAFDLVHKYTQYWRTDTETLVNVVAVLLERIEKLEKQISSQSVARKDTTYDKE